MSHNKQFTLFSAKSGPNGWKVAIILEELGLTYETIFLDFSKQEQKDVKHTQYNPNGRIPTLIDHHNNDFAIWESNAIILYLVDKYDTGHKISVSDATEKYTQLQWLFFQASGQGPYYGQLGWFTLFHDEKIPSAIERYQKEARRILGVLESVLSKRRWLVGDKPTIADISFLQWNELVVNRLMPGNLELQKEFPAVFEWHTKLGERPSVKKIRADKEAAAKN